MFMWVPPCGYGADEVGPLLWFSPLSAGRVLCVRVTGAQGAFTPYLGQRRAL